MIGIKVVIILSAVVLLVQCATCDFSRDEEAVFRMLYSYLDFRRRFNVNVVLPSLTLKSVRDHIEVLPKFTLSNALVGGLTLTDSQKFDIKPNYCPTTTMLACGQADVSDGFCLQLLDRVRDYIKKVDDYEGPCEEDSDSSPGDDESDGVYEGARASYRRRVRTATASSRQRRVPSITQVLSTDRGLLEVEYDRLSMKTEKEFHKQLAELSKRRDMLMVPKEEWVEMKSEDRSHQLKQSLATLKILENFPSHNREEWLRSTWSRRELTDISNGCYPEQFIACGEHVKSVADEGRKAEALRQCFEKIRKYNALRRISADLVYGNSNQNDGPELEGMLTSLLPHGQLRG